MSSSSRCADPDRRVLVAAALAALPAALLPRHTHARSGIAAPPEVSTTLDGAGLRGAGVLRFMGMPVYEARLWAAFPVSESDWIRHPIALELIYARSLEHRLIVERSIAEMRRQADPDAAMAERWRDAMAQLFPDVAPGDRLTGVMQPRRSDAEAASARFFFNAQPRGELRDTAFVRLFFGIWLGPQASQPALRARLLGQGRAP